jgi:hypothetical protein
MEEIDCTEAMRRELQAYFCVGFCVDFRGCLALAEKSLRTFPACNRTTLLTARRVNQANREEILDKSKCPITYPGPPFEWPRQPGR